MAQLAIRGHATRGREIIELLEMLGGNVDKKILSAANIGDILNPHVYFFDADSSDNRIVWYYLLGLECDGRASEMMIFTLEEFLEKFPYKVGDKIIYKSEVLPIIGMKWDCFHNIVIYTMKTDYDVIDCYDNTWMKPYKEETMEGKLISKEEMSLRIDTSQMKKRQIIFSADAPNETELVLGDNFEIKVEDGKTYVVRKKPQYPKTYVECAKILDCFGAAHIDGYKCELLEKLQELLVCRDAYWKIAGDWKPKRMVTGSGILVFPTEEMRNAFYENFMGLIESCKELL